MKKTLLTVAALFSMVAFGQKQGITDKGAADAFLDDKTDEFNPGIQPVSVEKTGFIKWSSLTNSPAKDSTAFKGIYWWVDGNTFDDFSFSWERKGDGKQTYIINQPEGAYEPIGVGFGQYAASATATTPSFFTLDLSENSMVELKFKNKTESKIKVTLLLQDSSGNELATTDKFFTTTPTPPKGDLYKYDIRKEVLATDTTEQTLSFDFSVANGSKYTFNPKSLYDCNDSVVVVTKEQTIFDYKKVKALTITVVDVSTDLGATKCFGRPSLIDGKLELTSFKIGNVSDIVAVNDPTVTKNFTDENVTVYNMLGAVVATGKVQDLNLENGFYIFKSANRTQKVIIK